MSAEDGRCDRCGATGRELRRHVTKAEPCPHCLRGENVAHRSPVLSEERICLVCYGALLDARRAMLKAQAETVAPKPAEALPPLADDEVPF